MAEIEVKIPAIEKLIDVVSSGVGSVTAPWVIRREAEAKAGAIKIIAKAQAEAKEIYKKTGDIEVAGESEIGKAIESKLQFQEQKRLANIKSIVAKTKEKLPVEISGERVNDDWSARFFANVQDVSTEELQEIWASILAGELETPGRTSLRTLDILKNMSKKDAELFEKAMKYRIAYFIFWEPDSMNDDMNLDINYGDMLYLEECGLLQMGSFLVFPMKFPKEYPFVNLHHQNEIELSVLRDGKAGDHPIQSTRDVVINVPIIKITNVGLELAKCIKDKDPQMYYLSLFSRFLKNKQYSLHLYETIGKIPTDAGFVTHSQRIPIEPAKS